MLGTPMGARFAPELRPEGPDQKSTATLLISMKNWGGWMCNSQPKGQIGLGVPYGSPFLLGFYYLQIHARTFRTVQTCMFKSGPGSSWPATSEPAQGHRITCSGTAGQMFSITPPLSKSRTSTREIRRPLLSRVVAAETTPTQMTISFLIRCSFQRYSHSKHFLLLHEKEKPAGHSQLLSEFATGDWESQQIELCMLSLQWMKEREKQRKMCGCTHTTSLFCLG